jgi:hypothetical protein
MALFNATHPTRTTNYVSTVVRDASPIPQAPAATRPRIRTEFGQTSSNQSDQSVTATTPANIQRSRTVGYYSTARAQMAIQVQELGVREPSGFPAYMASQTPTANDPAPTSQVNAQQYQNHLLFSYLPPATEVSEDTFSTLNDPTKREAVLVDLNNKLNSSATTLPAPLEAMVAPQTPVIPYAQPYNAFSGELCNAAVFGVGLNVGKVPLNQGGNIQLRPTNVPGFGTA